MYKKEHVVHLLQKIKQTLERIIANSKEIDSYQYYYLTPAGMERLETLYLSGYTIKDYGHEK